MNYQQFVSAVERRVRQQLGSGMSVCVHTVLKNNGKTRVGLNLSENGINIAPTIYLEEYFQQFQKNQSLDYIVRQIITVYREVRCQHSWETEPFQEYARMYHKIVYKVVHAEKNRELLREIPHVLYLDLAIVFYVLLEASESGTVSILITKEMMKIWGVDKEKIYEAAKKNTRKLLTAEFRTMRSVMKELLGEEEEDEEGEDLMYVLTNHIRSFGAACILYDNVLEDIGNQLNENFYVLPSSVHEVMIVPESKSPNRLELEEMIAEINDTQVEAEEILSYRAYYFSRKENRLLV